MVPHPLPLSELIVHLCPEAELLLACIRPHQDLETQRCIQRLAAGPIDWYRLLYTAEKHRVMPLLYRNLPTTPPSTMPTEVRQELRRRFFKNAQHNLRLTQELFSLLDLFAAQSVSAIPYKGTILAALAYGKISLRQVWDIDILVPEEDVEKSRQALLAEGFEIAESFDREQSFTHDERKVEVDLHWGLTPFYFPIDLSFPQLWEDRQDILLNATPIKSFSTEDLLLVLCIQLAKDCWERRQHIEHLAKVCDIASLLHSASHAESPLDWNKIFSQAQKLGVHRIVLFGLCLSQNLLNIRLPQPVVAKIQSEPVLGVLSKQVCQHLFGEYDKDFSDPRSAYSDVRARTRQAIFYFRLRERWTDRADYVYKIVKTVPEILSSP